MAAVVKRAHAPLDGIPVVAFVAQEALLTLTCAPVTSQLDYCNALYMGLPLKNICRFIWYIVNGIGYAAYVIMVLVLHWLPMCFQVQFKSLVATFKALHGFGTELTKRLFYLNNFYPSNLVQQIGYVASPVSQGMSSCRDQETCLLYCSSCPLEYRSFRD